MGLINFIYFTYLKYATCFPTSVLNWIVSFLKCRSQVIKSRNFFSLPLHINRLIIPGSGVGPTLYIIMESDLKHFRIAIYSVNMLMTLTLLFQVILGINEEFINIENWARANKMIINFSKTKTDCFQATRSKTFLLILRLSIILNRLMLLTYWVFFSNNFCFDAQVGNVLKMCSQRVYLKVLCEQGLSRGQLHSVFLALIDLRYALPSWSGLCTK